MIKRIIFALIIVVAFFGLVELSFRIFLFPGSYDYIERCVMDQGLHQRKAHDEYRIFLFGESTMHGHYLYPRSTIKTWMKLYLQDLLPETAAHRVTITNFGRLGEGSDFITQAFIETIPYKPDLAIFYIAHNDYTLIRHREAYFKPIPFKEKMKHFFGEIPKKSSFLTFMNRLYISARGKARAAKDSRRKVDDGWYTESQRPVSYNQEEMLLYPDSREFNIIKERFEANINKAIRLAGSHSIKTIFFEGVAKWTGYEPVRSVHNRLLTGDALNRWNDIDKRAEEFFRDNKFQNAMALYQECLNIDNAYALTYYRIGQCYEHMGDAAQANKYYIMANDKDCFPIRGPSVVNRFYESVRDAGIQDVSVIRTRDIFEQNSPGGIIGDDLIADQIHPTIKGQALMALEIIRVMYQNDLIIPKEEWRWNKLKSPEEMMGELGLEQAFKFNMYITLAGYVERRYDKAAEFLEKAVEIKPNSIFANSWLAWAYWKEGNKTKAFEIYEKLRGQAPDEAAKFFKEHPEIE
ncbi:MAG: tetratricopeptide repeat protein [Candidatus Omnitrophica bacterium]|nr:tetratricopeptide repeat protein [Candidatus Omnitrophota bacterium]